jgi:hypothetical protein
MALNSFFSKTSRRGALMARQLFFGVILYLQPSLRKITDI